MEVGLELVFGVAWSLSLQVDPACFLACSPSMSQTRRCARPRARAAPRPLPRPCISHVFIWSPSNEEGQRHVARRCGLVVVALFGKRLAMTSGKL